MTSEKSYRVPGYSGLVEGRPFKGGVVLWTQDKWGIWFKDAEGKYFCINGWAKMLTKDIPFLPGDVNPYFDAVGG